MIDASPGQIETVKRILGDHVPDCEVRAFGSRVGWTAKDYSDLDLVVVGEGQLDADTHRGLKEAFEESDLPFRVDVLDWHALSEASRKVIEKKYEVVQGGRKIAGMAGEWLERPLGELVQQKDFWTHAVVLLSPPPSPGWKRSGGRSCTAPTYRLPAIPSPLALSQREREIYSEVVLERRRARCARAAE